MVHFTIIIPWIILYIVFVYKIFLEYGANSHTNMQTVQQHAPDAKYIYIYKVYSYWFIAQLDVLRPSNNTVCGLRNCSGHTDKGEAHDVNSWNSLIILISKLLWLLLRNNWSCKFILKELKCQFRVFCTDACTFTLSGRSGITLVLYAPNTHWKQRIS